MPRLRLDLDIMPSPVEDRPGLLIRDSLGYSDAVLIVPPPLIQCLEMFDGERTAADLRELLVRITGELDVSPILDQLTEALQSSGFLEDEHYAALRSARRREFAGAAIREPAHAGSAYPPDEPGLRSTLSEYLTGGSEARAGAELRAIAAPHVSPFGGWQTYRAAYGALGEAHADRTFVILGTSHYGEGDRFGLTRKPFATPYGVAQPDLRLINELADQPAVIMEDYCHSVEHSIEFQIIFLQHLFGSNIKVLPILCGSFARSIYLGGAPEQDEAVARFLGQLGEIQAREGNRLLWILGVDMAHMGQRYGDRQPVVAGDGQMQEVAVRDRLRMDQIASGSAEGFWDLVQENQDDLKWCGSAPFYTFLKANPGARGEVRAYEQWNIDERSVVSFGAMTFR